MVFDPGSGIPDPERIFSDKFRFGCFNHARKLTDQTISLFCKVLDECPNSELVLKSISFHEQEERLRIRRRFEKQSIDHDRLIILEWVNGGLEHLACYNQIDAALDPSPYGGATTTAEALWMGVPVITQRHSGMAGCLSTSLLAYGNQSQWIANTNCEYLEIAKSLFKFGPRNKEDRMKLRLEMTQSPIGNPQRLSRELESLYLKLYQTSSEPSR